MKTEQKQAGWGFWLLWIAASVLGFYMGYIGGFVLCAFVYNLLGNAVADVVIVTSLGTGIGLMQWLVLQQRIPKAGWWILTNIAGILGLIKTATSRSIYQAEDLGPILIGTGLVAVCGAVTGTLQWLILRNKLARAGWWIPVSTIGWGLCLPILNGGLIGSGDPPAMLSILTGLAMLGAVTGGVMVWLLRQPTTNIELKI